MSEKTNNLGPWLFAQYEERAQPAQPASNHMQWPF